MDRPNPWHTIEWTLDGTKFPVVIEIPMGSKSKYEFDSKTGILILSRILHSSVRYPANYGFIPCTLGADGDPLDALVLCQEPIYPGAMVKVKAIGGLKLKDDKGDDDKILCVPLKDPIFNHYSCIEQGKGRLPDHVLAEISRFFKDYKALEDRKVKVGKTYSANKAMEVVRKSCERYRIANS